MTNEIVEDWFERWPIDLQRGTAERLYSKLSEESKGKIQKILLIEQEETELMNTDALTDEESKQKDKNLKKIEMKKDNLRNWLTNRESSIYVWLLKNVDNELHDTF